MRLRDKVALVTGGGTGIGRAIALAFAREGARVALNGRRVEPLEKTLGEITQAGGTGLAVPGDVTQAAEVTRVVEATVQRFGRLDVLVNNAGMNASRTAVLDCSEEDFRRTVDGSLVSVFLCSRQALPELIKSRGNILNIGSLAGIRGTTKRSAYGAAKAGVANLTKSMALDYGRHGVRFNCICPGFVETDINRAFLQGLKDKGRYDPLVRMHPLGRLGVPEDVAHAAVFLASDEASWMTGVVLPVDGGMMAGS